MPNGRNCPTVVIEAQYARRPERSGFGSRSDRIEFAILAGDQIIGKREARHGLEAFGPSFEMWPIGDFEPALGHEHHTAPAADIGNRAIVSDEKRLVFRVDLQNPRSPVASDAPDMKMAADCMQESLSAQFLSVKDCSNDNHREDERPQSSSLGSEAYVVGGK